MLYGSPSVTSHGDLRLENPETELFEPGEEADPLHSGRVVGIARRVADISPRAWRALVRRTLDALASDFRTAGAPAAELRQAIDAAHFPAEPADAEAARRKLAEEELSRGADRGEARPGRGAGWCFRPASPPGGRTSSRSV